MFKTIKNAFKSPDVRKRLLYTLLLIVIFRFGCYVTVPGVDSIALDNLATGSGTSISNLIDIISGGAFSKLSIFAMTITPYITASIVIQLLGMVIPSLERAIKEGGEEGKAKVNRYTKLLTVFLALIEATGLYLTYSNAYKGLGVFINPGFGTACLFVISLMAGTALLMWLGDQITNKGIGNGISMIIFVGIISSLPGAAVGNTHIPLKLAMAGVMPVIFASSFLTFPAMIIPMFNNNIATASGFWATIYKFSMSTSTAQFGIGYTIANAIVYLLLIVGFTYFYTYATFNPAEVSNNIKKNGGFIPGIRAGKPTADYLSSIMKKLTLFGGIFLSIIAILPMLLSFTGLNISFGGTSILIVVGVALEMVEQLESRLVMRHYKGFLE